MCEVEPKENIVWLLVGVVRVSKSSKRDSITLLRGLSSLLLPGDVGYIDVAAPFERFGDTKLSEEQCVPIRYSETSKYLFVLFRPGT